MPYSSISEVPDYIKKLGSKLATAWMKAFNAAHKQYGTEAQAFKVANAMLKKMKAKQS